jgi:membrane-bound lytic murein transglycosylase A
MEPSRKILIVVALVFIAAGCRQESPTPPAPALDYTRELPPGKLALRKLSPAEYPDFSVMQTNAADLQRAAANSALYLSAPSSQRFFPYLDITHPQAMATARDLQRLAAMPTVNWNAEIRARYDVYQSIGAPNPAGDTYSGQVLFTGYFTPIYDASLVRAGPYQWPLYKRPADLVSDDSGDHASRRQISPGAPPRQPPPGAPEMVPLAADNYWTRAEIERDGKLAGQELVWLKSRWEAYVVTIQGSARLRLTDGRIYEIGFAGTNGHAYVSPGKQMIADGVISRDQLSLRGLAQYFQEHPQAMDQYLWMNPRTTFFTERKGGPYGKLNVPVTPFASIATDKEVYPRAMPAYVVAKVARPGGGELVPYRGMAFDQDAGGAIRSAGRCDIYMGVGPAAEALAGQQLSPGQLYYLAIKKELIQGTR